MWLTERSTSVRLSPFLPTQLILGASALVLLRKILPQACTDSVGDGMWPVSPLIFFPVWFPRVLFLLLSLFIAPCCSWADS